MFIKYHTYTYYVIATISLPISFFHIVFQLKIKSLWGYFSRWSELKTSKHSTLLMTSLFSPDNLRTNFVLHVLRQVVLKFLPINSSVGSLRPGTFDIHPKSSKNILIICLIVNPCDTTNIWGSFSFRESFWKDFQNFIVEF